jgi:4-hydroxy-L-threonine phosphate dehydrogenase PdxA
MNGWIGISIGDVTGIGPEVALKAVDAESQNDDIKYLFIGDEKNLERLNQKLGLNLPLKKFSTYANTGRFFITNPFNEPLSKNLPNGSPIAARASVAWLRGGGERCMRRELDALVTAPVNKESIIRAGHKFIGQTEFLSELAGTKRTAMMLLGHDDKNRWLRVALATVHIGIKSVSEKLTTEKITLAIELAAQACRDLGLPRSKIAVAGLNPHAGEGGEFGDEEITR